MACTQPSSFDLAADYGIGVLAFGVGAPGNVVDSLKRYKERIAKPTRQVGKVVTNAVAPATLMYCAEDARKALDMGAVAALWYGAQTAKLFAPWAGKDVAGYEYYGQLANDPEFAAPFPRAREDAMTNEYSLIGTPDRVAERVQASVAIGAAQTICMIQADSIPHDKI